MTHFHTAVRLQGDGTQIVEAAKTAADGAAGTATAETVACGTRNGGRLLAVRFIPAAALTADNTNYATITVSRRNAAGGGKTTVASVTTQITGSGSWTAFVPVNVPVSNDALEPGGTLTYEIAKAGTGVVVPVGSFEFIFSDAR